MIKGELLLEMSFVKIQTDVKVNTDRREKVGIAKTIREVAKLPFFSRSWRLREIL